MEYFLNQSAEAIEPEDKERVGISGKALFSIAAVKTAVLERPVHQRLVAVKLLLVFTYCPQTHRRVLHDTMTKGGEFFSAPRCASDD